MTAIVKHIGSKPYPAAVIESITPAKAEEWLRTQVSNRKPSDKKIIEYGLAMEAGQWRLNGSTIVFDDQNRLIDGQQRLRACILAGVHFRSYVVRGVDDPEAFATIDTGKGRSHADVFGIEGWQNNKVASAAAMAIYLIKEGIVSWSGITNKRAKRNSALLQKFQGSMPSFDVVSREQLCKFSESIRSELEQSVRFANASKASRIIPSASVAALHYLFRQRSVTSVEQFFADLGEGLGLKRDDPVYVLREKLMKAKRSEARMTRWAILGFCIKAWNKRRDGDTLGVLRLQEGEAFPKVK
jgi:hypothetical protein